MGQYYTPDYWVFAEPDVRGDLGAGFSRTLMVLTRDHAGGRVLDVGCGAGRQASALKARGLSVVGIDPYEDACRVARERFGVEAICATLQTAALEPGSFDAVTFFDVLEHVHDPVADLRRVHSLLRPGGSVLVRAPNIDALQARLLRRRWFLEVPRHLFHFSPHSLGRALSKAGFSSICCRAIAAWRFGADQFEMSVLQMLRAWQFTRTGVQVTPTDGQSVAEALEGKVYPSVPSTGTRLFRWFLRNVLYAPIGLENAIGRSVELLAIARKI